jgi:diguanylate cyclase (GGDEF)-like protein
VQSGRRGLPEQLVDGHFFISLLNPAIGLLLAGAFLVLWLYQREKRYVAVISFGYTMSALGFALREITPLVETPLIKLASNGSFFLAAACLTGALVNRYGRPVPYAGLALLAGAGMAALSFFLFVEPSLTNRIYAVNFALGGIALLAAFELSRVPRQHSIDRVIFAVCVLAAANFIIRTAVVLHLAGPQDNDALFSQSIYWATVQVSHALISIMLALSLIVATTLDLVTQLKTDSETDKLSGLLNRRGFDEAANALIRECAAANRPAALVIADLDHFKSINDTFGHATGDRVISAFGKLLRAASEAGMVAGRIGGEEFAVLIPGSTPSAARLFAEGVRAAIGAVEIDGLRDRSRLTASFGVCTLAAGDTLTDMLHRADDALYMAKRDGRDRVRVLSTALELVPGSGGRANAAKAS